MKVFIDSKGLFYKANARKHPDDAERSVITSEFIEVLPADGSGMALIDAEEAVKRLRNQRSEPGYTQIPQ